MAAATAEARNSKLWFAPRCEHPTTSLLALAFWGMTETWTWHGVLVLATFSISKTSNGTSLEFLWPQIWYEFQIFFLPELRTAQCRIDPCQADSAGRWARTDLVLLGRNRLWMDRYCTVGYPKPMKMLWGIQCWIQCFINGRSSS